MSFTKMYKVAIIRTIPDFVEEGYHVDNDDRERTLEAFCIVNAGNTRGALHKSILHIHEDLSMIIQGLPDDIKFEKDDNSTCKNSWDAVYKNEEYRMKILIKQINPVIDYNFISYKIY